MRDAATGQVLTLELLGLLLDEISSWPMMLIATFRPEFQAPWGHRTHVTQLSLSRLTETQTTAGKGVGAQSGR